MSRVLPWLALPAALLAGLALQTQLYAGQERTATTVLMFVALAVGWNLLGGGAGITIPTVEAGAPTPWLGNDGFYVLFLGLAVGAVAVALFVARSRAGYALRAIHQDEDAAAAMGVNTTVAKTLALAVSAAV